MVAEKGYVISGGKDKKIAIINASKGEFKLEKFVDMGASFCRSIDILNGNLLVGLKNGSIAEFKNVLEGDEPKEVTLLQSHFEGELWGLEIVDENHVITCGDDNRIMLFNTETKQCERIGKLSEHKPKNAAKAKAVTASSMSVYPANQ